MPDDAKKLTKLAELKARFLKDEAFRTAYAEADAEYRLIEEEIRRKVRKASAAEHESDAGS